MKMISWEEIEEYFDSLNIVRPKEYEEAIQEIKDIIKKLNESQNEDEEE